MSSRKNNNINNKKLEDFLGAKNTEKDSLDDFDREALEGFSLLENTEEALAAKSELDAKIYPALFSTKETKPKAFIWYAAAGLILLVGFSIYYLTTSPLNNQKDLAENTLQKNEEPANIESQLSIKDSLKEKINQPNLEAKEGLEMTHDLSPPPTELKAQKRLLIKNNMVASGNSNATTFKAVQSDGSTKKNEPNDLDDVKSLSANEDISLVKEQQKSEPMVLDTVSNVSAINSASVSYPTANTYTNQAIVNNAAPINVSPSYASPAGSVNYAREITYSNANEIEISSKQKSLKKESSSKEAVSKEAETKRASTTKAFKLCNYVGGLESFNRDVKALLIKENLNKAFKGSMFVASNKVVVSVTIDTSAFTSKEKKRVDALLKSLTNFVLSDNSNVNEFFVYAFDYKP
jgi:hypothetical protein